MPPRLPNFLIVGAMKCGTTTLASHLAAHPEVFMSPVKELAFFERDPTRHNGYIKQSFGIVHVRTDGQRVLVATHSGKDDRKESYVFHVDERGDVKFSEEPSIL